MKKAALHNLGCKVNSYETEAMQQLLEERGYEIVPFTEKADVYVINTCSVTNIADRKSRQMLHRARRLNPDAVVVAAGCYVQTAGQEAFLDGAVDILLGNNQKHLLVDLLEQWQRPPIQSVVDINDGQMEFEELQVSRTGGHTRAFLKVQDGCNQFCSYCVIPYARGRVRSRDMEQVKAEVRQLAKGGYREIVLTGIHLSSYGVDTGSSLLSLITELHEIPGIERIRLGSLEPKIVTEEFAKALSELPKVCPHFHLSLQSGCDTTLKRMNRRYTCEEYRESCKLLRKYFQHPALTTDVIVGFPGETREEFELSREFVREMNFFEVHIFKYSKRQGTKAADMPDQILEDEKHRRSILLAEDQHDRNREFLQWYQGRQAEVLLEETTTIQEQSYYVGHTPEYVKVAVVWDGEQKLENQLIQGRIVDCLPGNILLLENID